MIVFHQNAFPSISMLLAAYFLLTSFFSLYLYFRINPTFSASSKQQIYFSVMAIGQALYSYCAWKMFSTPFPEFFVVWQKIQWCAGAWIFWASVMFSMEYLDLKIKWIQPLLFILGFIFAIFAISDQFHEMPMGIIVKLVDLWMLLILFPLLLVWFFYLTQSRLQLRPVALGMVFFILAELNDKFVSLDYYQSPYVMEYGFFFFSLAFYYQSSSIFINKNNNLRID